MLTTNDVNADSGTKMNLSFNFPSTPAHPYTPTPTPHIDLPPNTPDPGCKTSFQHLAKNNFKPKKRMDLSNGFPFIDPSDTKQPQIIEIISESTPQQIKDNLDQNENIFIVNNTDQMINNGQNESKQTEKHNVRNLKISIPINTNSNSNLNSSSNIKNKSHKRRKSKTFKLVEPDDIDLFHNEEKEKKEILSLEEITLLLHGYKKDKYLCDTLQGHVMMAYNKSNGEYVIIKTSNKLLHDQHMTQITKQGKQYKIEEDIIKEAKLMKLFISDKNVPSAMIKFYDFFEDKENYYLVMENGGNDLFDFIVSCHDLIMKNKISIREWRKHVKFMFAQMILFISWMHKKQHCANLDISLENMLITHNVKIYENMTENEFKLNKCYVKFIDFGLSEKFDRIMNPCFLCNKFVGKQRYKAPEVYAMKDTFCADKADIWSLGVVLFMMIIGSPPYEKPINDDIAYRYIKAQKINELLISWKRVHYLTANLLDLLNKMLCEDPSKRITIDGIMKHPWLKIYFT